jgi:anti-sigma B factor antagonist
LGQTKHQQGETPVSFNIVSRQVDGLTILDLRGKIILGEGSVTLRDSIRNLISNGSKSILVNLGEVTYMDSSGLGELVGAYTSATNQGASLKLLNLTKKVHDLLQITKLYTVFDIYDNEEDAIASYK